jgi:hypothetical protein
MRGTQLAWLFGAVIGPRVFPQSASHLGATALRRSLIATMAAALLGGPAFAQTSSTPSLLPTSPLGMTTSRSVAPVGIPLGATELGTTGVSPLPNGASSFGTTTGSTIPCSVAGSATSGTSSSTGTFDGGGIAAMPSTPATTSVPGTGTTGTGGATGMAMAGTGASPCTSSTGSSAMSPSSPSMISPGGASRAGIPMGSTEIGNAGISGVPTIPAPTPTPSNILPGSSQCPTNTSGFPGVC